MDKRQLGPYRDRGRIAALADLGLTYVCVITGEVLVTDAACREYQTMTMGLGYMAPDRRELQHASRELAREVSRSSVRSEQALKRACWFLLASGRCIPSFPRQTTPTTLQGCSDTDRSGVFADTPLNELLHSCSMDST